MTRIKTRIIYTLNYRLKDNEVLHAEEDPYVSSYTVFNEGGQAIQEEQHDHDGILLESYHRMYSESGKLLEERYETGEDGPVSSRFFTYDANDKLLEERGEYAQGGSEVIHYEYDVDGNLVSRLCHDDEGEEEYKEEYRYEESHLTEETRWEYGEMVFHRTIEYDALGSVLATTDENFGEGSKRERSFTYDAQGRLSTESEFIDGKILTRKTYRYDADSRIVAILEEEAFRRDEVLFQYDEHGNLTLQEEKDQEGNVLQRIERYYDEQGELERAEVFMSGIRTGYARAYALKYSYTYFSEEV